MVFDLLTYSGIKLHNMPIHCENSSPFFPLRIFLFFFFFNLFGEAHQREGLVFTNTIHMP